jgi:hypothetical protein
MKIGMHPLVVAVALGLLAPTALAEESEEEAERRPGACEGCTCGAASLLAEAPSGSDLVVCPSDLLALDAAPGWAPGVDLSVP